MPLKGKGPNSTARFDSASGVDGVQDGAGGSCITCHRENERRGPYITALQSLLLMSKKRYTKVRLRWIKGWVLMQGEINCQSELVLRVVLIRKNSGWRWNENPKIILPGKKKVKPEVKKIK